MDNLVTFILNGSTSFTPEVFVRLIVFVLTLDSITALARAIFGGVK